MDSSFALRGKDCVVMVADASAAGRSIVKAKNTQDKIVVVDGNKLMVVTGNQGDCKQFSDYIKANVQLTSIRQGRLLPIAEVANFTRSELAYAIRNGPYLANLLVAGPVDSKDATELYWLDYLGSMVKTETAAHGYAAAFVLSILDRYHHENLSREEAIEIARKCCCELKKRFVIQQSEFVMKIVSNTGEIETQYVVLPNEPEAPIPSFTQAPTTAAVSS